MFALDDVDYWVEIKARDAQGRIQKVRHGFRRAEKDELLEYERRLPRLEFQRGGKQFRVGSITDAQLYLWERLIGKVEGYSLAGQDLMTRPDWKERVPLEHRTLTMGQHYAATLTPDEAGGDGEGLGDPFASSSAAGSIEPNPDPAARA